MARSARAAGSAAASRSSCVVRFANTSSGRTFGSNSPLPTSASTFRATRSTALALPSRTRMSERIFACAT